MDIVKQRRMREVILLSLVGVMALVANLPQQLLDAVGLERGVLMAVLGLVVLMAVFLYVRFFFFLLYTLLAIGANLPERWAESLHISQGPLLMALIAMVSISLLNYSTKLLPSGLEPKQKKQNPEAIQVLLSAIERGNPAYIRTVLGMDIDLNMLGENALSPLMCAAQRGDQATVELLLRHGADPCFGPAGRHPADLAAAAGHSSLAAMLRALELAAEQSRQQQAQATSDPVTII